MKTEKVLYLAKWGRSRKLRVVPYVCWNNGCCTWGSVPLAEVWRVTGSPAEEARRRVARVKAGEKGLIKKISDPGVVKLWPKEETE